jgi:hypothetical protein
VTAVDADFGQRVEHVIDRGRVCRAAALRTPRIRGGPA